MLLKICGMTRQEDLDHAANAGFDMCGFVFSPKSSRYIKPEYVARFETAQMKRVGVFVDNSVCEIQEIMNKCDLDYAQLHGPYSQTDADKIGMKKVIRVLWPTRYSSIDELTEDACKFDCAFYLLDSGSSGGGSGKTLKWRSLRNLELPSPWLLAGGLDSENISTAIRECNPAGLDFNSGLEQAPGCKIKEKIMTAAMLAHRGRKS